MIAVWTEAAPHAATAVAELDRLGAEHVTYSRADDAAHRQRVAGAKVQLVGGGPVSADDLAALPATELIVRAGIGVDKIDLAAAGDRGIAVANTPTYCVDEVADHTWTVLLAAWRGLSTSAAQVGKHWHEVTPATTNRLRGRTLGIIGLGRIGRRVARRARGFDLDVIAHDPLLGEDEVDGVPLVGRDELFACSDIVTLHVPLAADTEHLLDHAAFAAMARRPLVVNTARGGLIDTDALVAALDGGQVRGAALDAVEGEPDVGDRAALAQRADVVLTPHVGWYSVEALHDLGAISARAAYAYDTGGTLPDTLVVGPVTRDEDTDPHADPTPTEEQES